MRTKGIILLYIIAHFFVLSLHSFGSNNTKEKMNVLFIVVDDLRLQAGIFGQKQMHTPALDQLGKEGVVFNRAYCSVPVCGASRASLLSGLRPTPTRFVDYNTSKDDDAPHAVSIPGWFKQNGYTTLSRGKVYHHTKDDLDGWSEEPWISMKAKSTWRDYVLEENLALQNNPEIKSGPSYECAEVPDNAYRDGRIADKAIQDLNRFKKSGEPFFLALGFVKPHLPFNAPKKYWDLYNENKIQLANNPNKPQNAPRQAMHTWGELRAYSDIPKKGPVSDQMARKLIHGYYACVSYADAQIGKILDELKHLNLAENTIVVLWGDHGWHLGEHGLWCKHCNFDKVLKAPLIIKAPGKAKGATSNSLAEFIDIYPTLCELSGLDLPEHLDGKSLVPVLNDPNATHKNAVFSRFKNGESVITKNFVYTQWINKGQFVSHMLYDHKSDPEENINVVEQPEYDEVVKEMRQLLHNNNQALKTN